MVIDQRIASLRSVLKERHADAMIISGTDPHQSEYVPERWRTREWISGFSGSAGTVVITHGNACIWSDFRYYIQAEEELEGTEFQFFKAGEADVPTYTEWLSKNLKPGAVVAVNAATLSVTQYRQLEKQLLGHSITLKADVDILDMIWADRPAIPDAKISDYPVKYAGRSRVDKLEEARKKLDEQGATHHLISSLDTIAWLLNLRGHDVKHTPIFLAYVLVGPENTTLFVRKDKLSGSLQKRLRADNVVIQDYEQLYAALSQLPDTAKMMIEPAKTAFNVLSAIPENCQIIESQSPVEMMKCIKNHVEVQGMSHASRRDCAAMAEFLCWLEERVPTGGVTELSVAEKLIELRGADALFLEPSFPSIAGYLEHGALCHYCADESSSFELRPEGLFLIDSGGQYWDGTTDITRTVALGPVDDQTKRDFTLVLKSHIQLASVIFPEGTTGGQLEVLGKYALWQDRKSYNHGPGHGLGVCLGVHEGPAGFGKGNSTPLKPGMILTNEPGLYREGAYGIRIENTVTVVAKEATEFGKFLGFETISFCPIDTRAVAPELLSAEEKRWLNDYHKKTWESLESLVSPEARAWLEGRCQPVM